MGINDRLYKTDIEYYVKTETVEETITRMEHERQRRYKLRFDFIPKLQESRNVRSASAYLYDGYAAWTEIRNFIEKCGKGKCEVCGKTSFERQEIDPKITDKEQIKRLELIKNSGRKATTSTECHEVWKYEERTKNGFERVQELVKLSPRCFYCHKISHLNQVFDNKVKNVMLEDYCVFNRVTLEQAKKDYDFAIEQRDKNESYEFKLDMSLINKLPVKCRFELGLFNPHEKSFVSFLYTNFLDDE